MSSMDRESHIIAAEGGAQTEDVLKKRIHDNSTEEIMNIYLFQILESEYKTLDTFPLKS